MTGIPFVWSNPRSAVFYGNLCRSQWMYCWPILAITRRIAVSLPGQPDADVNHSLGAVSRVAVFALAGMADRAAEVIEQSTGARPKFFITGGDAGMITGTMRTHGEIVPDLVLQGLAVIAARPR